MAHREPSLVEPVKEPMPLLRTTPPAYLPITLAQARAQCRIDSDMVDGGIYYPPGSDPTDQ